MRRRTPQKHSWEVAEVPGCGRHRPTPALKPYVCGPPTPAPSLPVLRLAAPAEGQAGTRSPARDAAGSPPTPVGAGRGAGLRGPREGGGRGGSRWAGPGRRDARLRGVRELRLKPRAPVLRTCSTSRGEERNKVIQDARGPGFNPQRQHK